MSANPEKSSFGPALRAAVAVTGLVNSGKILEALSDGFFERDRLPEPFDIPDHIGNFTEAAIVTSATSFAVGMFTCALSGFDGESEKFRKGAKVAAVSGFLISSAVQVIGEKYGISNILGAVNTPDMVDAGYGVAWSGVTAIGSYKYAVNTEKRTTAAREVRTAETGESIKESAE